MMINTLRNIHHRRSLLSPYKSLYISVEIVSLILLLSGCQYSIDSTKDSVNVPSSGATSAKAKTFIESATATLEDIKTASEAAFPGAEGFGARTPGGRGGIVIAVINLNDSGPGSLRAAVEKSGPRTVVFRVAGTIELQSSLDIKNPYITIAGQTAPGGGITLRNVHKDADPLIDIKTHDVIIRYLTLRAGPPAAGDAMNIASRNHAAYNIVIDHNSMSWGVDQVFTTWYDVHDISIQWNIFSEALDCSIHSKGCHSKGPMLGSYSSDENNNQPGAEHISFHHNLMAHNGERNPLIKTSGICDVVNNVIYNPYWAFIHVDMESQLMVIPANVVGNYFKQGPNTDSNAPGIQAVHPGALGAEIYVRGNIGPQRLSDQLPEINVVAFNSREYLYPKRHPAVSVITSTAWEAYEDVLAGAGSNVGLDCEGTFFPRRDKIDQRIVNDVINGTGKIINDPMEVGGWLAIPPAVPCDDTDLDGMPDVWERVFGFNQRDPSDSSQDTNRNGYTNLEEYLNGKNPITK